MTKALQENGVDIMRGQGKLDGPRRIIVVSNNNNNNSYTGSDDSNSSNNGTAITKLLVANHAVVLRTGSRGSYSITNKRIGRGTSMDKRNATSAKEVLHVHLQ